MKKQPKVTVIIPTKNSAKFLKNCLESIKKQTYKNIETIIVDGKSTDETQSIAKKYKIPVFICVPKVPKGTFDAPHKKNYGAKKAKGKYVYTVDADMELTKNVIKEAVEMCERKNGPDALIIPEDSFGKGIWASAKNLERRCYWGDDTIESPRFAKKTVWMKVGGLDENLGGGGEDWDFYQKLQDKGYKTKRIKSMVMHNEGELQLTHLIKKRFMYGRDSLKYISKRPKAGTKSYFPIREAYLKNWKLFASRPVDALAFIIMRTSEYAAGLSGIIYTFLRRDRILYR